MRGRGSVARGCMLGSPSGQHQDSRRCKTVCLFPVPVSVEYFVPSSDDGNVLLEGFFRGRSFT